MSVLANAFLPAILPRLTSLLLSILRLLRLNKLDLAPRFVNTLYIYIYNFFYLYCIILRTILRIQPLGYSAIVLYI